MGDLSTKGVAEANRSLELLIADSNHRELWGFAVGLDALLQNLRQWLENTATATKSSAVAAETWEKRSNPATLHELLIELSTAVENADVSQQYLDQLRKRLEPVHECVLFMDKLLNRSLKQLEAVLEDVDQHSLY